MNEENVLTVEDVAGMLYAAGFKESARIVRNAIDVRTWRIEELVTALRGLLNQDAIQAGWTALSAFPPIQCVGCGEPASRRMIPDIPGLAPGHSGTELCEACIAGHVAQAEETNAHEIRYFGGQYGLISYHFEPLVR